jgi:hypothetical protein
VSEEMPMPKMPNEEMQLRMPNENNQGYMRKMETKRFPELELNKIPPSSFEDLQIERRNMYNPPTKMPLKDIAQQQNYSNLAYKKTSRKPKKVAKQLAEGIYKSRKSLSTKPVSVIEDMLGKRKN